MKTMKLIPVLILILFMISCQGERGPTGPKGGWSDATTDTPLVNIEYVQGKGQKGACKKKKGAINVQLMDTEWAQTSGHYTGDILNDSGKYKIKVKGVESYGRYDLDANCFNEVDGGYNDINMMLIADMSDEDRFINPATTIQAGVATEYFDDDHSAAYQSPVASLSMSQADVLNYFDLPDTGVKFQSMTLEGDTTADAVLAIISSVVAQGRNGPEINDFMQDITNGILNNDLTLREEIIEAKNNLPIIQIRNNLRAKYTELGLGALCPPIWRFYDNYYSDLLEREPKVLEQFNLYDNTSCSFDQSTFNLFAIPHRFTSLIEASRYIATNLPPDAQISIWTRGTHVDGYDAPGIEVVSAETMAEVMLEDPVKLTYNGVLGDHGAKGATDYYIVIRKDTDFVLSTTCEGGLLPWGRKLASEDEGATWIGHNNDTPWFRKSGLKIVTYD